MSSNSRTVSWKATIIKALTNSTAVYSPNNQLTAAQSDVSSLLQSVTTSILLGITPPERQDAIRQELESLKQQLKDAKAIRAARAAEVEALRASQTPALLPQKPVLTNAHASSGHKRPRLEVEDPLEETQVQEMVASMEVDQQVRSILFSLPHFFVNMLYLFQANFSLSLLHSPRLWRSFPVKYPTTLVSILLISSTNWRGSMPMVANGLVLTWMVYGTTWMRLSGNPAWWRSTLSAVPLRRLAWSSVLTKLFETLKVKPYVSFLRLINILLSTSLAKCRTKGAPRHCSAGNQGWRTRYATPVGRSRRTNRDQCNVLSFRGVIKLKRFQCPSEAEQNHSALR